MTYIHYNKVIFIAAKKLKSLKTLISNTNTSHKINLKNISNSLKITSAKDIKISVISHFKTCKTTKIDNKKVIS
ncbi:hypothetical protein CMT92_09715 [Elizabethkingia anophelis]|nr:hypothetical protein AS358_09660 [Elizabethkingia anophelis]MDV3847931.1 hypothetical protein [Elizabethkingia anophelis]CAH1152424.1 hypothetical protein EAVNVH72_02422 [Elizabethkingia anophelis]CAI9686984.1 hypothetical protein EAVNVH72_03555 [Elizabethkingia anophelis]